MPHIGGSSSTRSIDRSLDSSPSSNALVPSISSFLLLSMSWMLCLTAPHIPLADYALIAQSHFGRTGAATAIGEQPIKGTNLLFTFRYLSLLWVRHLELRWDPIIARRT